MSNNKLRALFICLLGTVFYGFQYYLLVLPSAMMGELQAAFNLNDAQFGSLSGSYYYIYVPMQLVAGMALDRFKPADVLAIACATCSLGAYVFACSSTVLGAFVGRLLIGFGASFAYVGAIKLASKWLTIKFVVFMAGLCTTVGTLVGASCKFVTQNLLLRISWQVMLMYIAIFGLAISTLLAIWSRFAQDKLDTEVDGHVATCSNMFKNHQLWLVGLIGCLMYMPIGGFAGLWCTPFLESIVGFSPTNAAWGTACLFTSFGVGSLFIWGIIGKEFDNRKIALAIGAFIAAISAMLLVIFPASHKILTYGSLTGLGLGSSAQILIFAIATKMYSPKLSGTVNSIANMLVSLGGSITQPLIGFLLNFSISRHARLNFLHSYEDFRGPLLILPFSLLLAACLSLMIKTHKDVSQATKI